MNRQPYSGHSIDIEMVTETAALLLFLLLKMNISDRGGKNMKSKIVRGIINGGVLAAVAALGITVYQLGTKPIAENPQEENSVQVEETGLEEELSDGENAEDAAAAGDGWQDAAQDEISDGETGDEAGLSGASEAGADGVAGSIRETAGSGTAENAAADADNGSGTEDRSVSAAAGADRSRTDGTGNTADNAGNTSAEGVVNNGAGASTDTAETSAVGIAAQALDFTEDSIMEWPVRGTVLVDYNMDETVYYPTLDQYRVSSAIALQAVEDAPVYAAADGQVLSVVQDACTGTTVTMELGNGYQAVYGQLKDLTVAEGDTVKEGEVIGNISAPTKYYSVEGPNLYFAMKKDGVPVDPFEYLE